MSISGQTALITGGGTGIGRGVALALARRGVRVFLAGRRADVLSATVEELRRLGAAADTLPVDLADDTERSLLWQRATEAAGAPPSLLIHSAGQFPRGRLTEISGQALTQTVQVNLTTPLDLTRTAIPDLAAAQGTVVLVGSLASFLALPNAATYAATKTGIAALAVSLRYELDPLGIRLLLVYPPTTDTAMVRGMARAAPRRWPLATPESVGERIALALDQSRTGALNLMTPLERTAALVAHWAPGLTQALLRSQRQRFDRMMSANARD